MRRSTATSLHHKLVFPAPSNTLAYYSKAFYKIGTGSSDDSGDGFDVNRMRRKNDARDNDARSRRQGNVG
jgi:hypothetical protein